MAVDGAKVLTLASTPLLEFALVLSYTNVQIAECTNTAILAETMVVYGVLMANVFLLDLPTATVSSLILAILIANSSLTVVLATKPMAADGAKTNLHVSTPIPLIACFLTHVLDLLVQNAALMEELL